MPMSRIFCLRVSLFLPPQPPHTHTHKHTNSHTLSSGGTISLSHQQYLEICYYLLCQHLCIFIVKILVIEKVYHLWFNLHDECCEASFHMLICHLYIFWEVFVQVYCPFLLDFKKNLFIIFLYIQHKSVPLKFFLHWIVCWS